MFEKPIFGGSMDDALDGWKMGFIGRKELQQHAVAAVQSRDSIWRRQLVGALSNQPSAPVKPLDSSLFHQDPAPDIVLMGRCGGAGSCSLYQTAEDLVEKDMQGPRLSNVGPVRVPGRRGHRMLGALELSPSGGGGYRVLRLSKFRACKISLRCWGEERNIGTELPR